MPSRRHRDVVDALLGRIVAGEFAPGTLLPKEQDVAATYDVNRGTAREALRALEERNVAIVRHGRGAVVQPREAWNVLDPVVAGVLLGSRGRGRLLGEIGEARRSVEPALAALAAERASAASAAALAGAVDAIEAGTAGMEAFVTALGAAAANRPLAATAVALHRLPGLGPPHPGPLRDVVAAIAAGSPDEARTAMERAVGGASALTRPAGAGSTGHVRRGPVRD